MVKALELNEKTSFVMEPIAPYNFNANFHKPSHFPSSDNFWNQESIGLLWFGNVKD